MASLSTCPNCKREFIANAKGQYCPECWSAWSRNDGTYERREKSGLVLAGEAVKVKPLEWRDHPHAFPAPTWSAKTPFGFYNLEEISASDSPAYEVRLHAHHLVAITDSLDAAKDAAQADYDQRIRSALVAPQPDWFSQVVSFFVKNDMLDERDEYDIGDVMAALQDNYDPAQPVEAQPVAWRDGACPERTSRRHVDQR